MVRSPALSPGLMLVPRQSSHYLLPGWELALTEGTCLLKSRTRQVFCKHITFSMRWACLFHGTDDKTEDQNLPSSPIWEVAKPGMGPGLSPGSLLAPPHAHREKQQEHRAKGLSLYSPPEEGKKGSLDY